MRIVRIDEVKRRKKGRGGSEAAAEGAKWPRHLLRPRNSLTAADDEWKMLLLLLLLLSWFLKVPRFG